MVEEQNPLRREIEAKLKDSEWLQKFKAWSLLLQHLKSEFPIVQLCQLQWVTGADDLVIHCPNVEVRATLERQVQEIGRLNKSANQIIVRLAGYNDLLIRKSTDTENPQP
ncbi:MAG: hypothetical protein AAGG51_00160 [Cyanobacteria bacterium P01_G01_bin.54]